MGDTFFEIITPTRSIYAQYNGRAPRTLTVGETETFEFVFPTRDRTVSPPADLTVASDTTIPAGETRTVGTTTVEAGATLTVNGTLNTVDLVDNGSVDVNGDLTIGAIERLRVAADEVRLLDALTVEDGAEVVVESGGVLQVHTLTNKGQVTGGGTVLTGSTVEILQEYAEFAGAYATLELLTNELKFREQLPSDAPRDSLVVGVRPASDLRDRDVPAVWGLVDDVRDAREPVLSEKRIEITVRILAPFDEYTDLSAVETAFEV